MIVQSDLDDFSSMQVHKYSYQGCRINIPAHAQFPLPEGMGPHGRKEVRLLKHLPYSLMLVSAYVFFLPKAIGNIAGLLNNDDKTEKQCEPGVSDPHF